MNEHQEILQVVQTYCESLFNGDVERLRGVFHENAALFGEVKGAPYYRPLGEYLEAVRNRKSPAALGETYRMKPLSVDVQGAVGVARVHCPMLGFNYIDFLSFVRIDGRWLIANKTFTHVEPLR
jgi:Putative lumazine-binding